MSSLAFKKIDVVGGSHGVGKAIVSALAVNGANVVAVARDKGALDDLAKELPQVEICPLDATCDIAPDTIYALEPDAVVVAAGAIPPTAPLSELDWDTFTRNWEVDVRMSFELCKAALIRPMKPGGQVILISSAAAIGGSPISGGYAAAKRMQMFLASYAQREGERLGRDLRFTAIAPARPMPDTRIGEAAVAGYARFLNVAPADFLAGTSDRQSVGDVARAVIETLSGVHANMGPMLAWTPAKGLHRRPDCFRWIERDGQRIAIHYDGPSRAPPSRQRGPAERRFSSWLEGPELLRRFRALIEPFSVTAVVGIELALWPIGTVLDFVPSSLAN